MMDLRVDISSSGVGYRCPSPCAENKFIKASGVVAHFKDNCVISDVRTASAGGCLFWKSK